MSNWQDPLTEQIIVTELENTAKYRTPGGLYGIYINNKPVYLTKARVYMQKGRALSELRRYFRYRLGPDGQKINQKLLKTMIDSLIDQKIIEIREI